MDQRFYASTYGRFNTADPYRASAGAAEPGSWNRYGYVDGDPIGRLDATGLDYTLASGQQFDPRDPRNVDITSISVNASGDNVASRMAYGREGAKTETDQSIGEHEAPMSGLSLCDFVPDGRTLSLNGSLRIPGGVSVSAEVVFDHHTGNASLLFGGGFGLSGSAAQAGVGSGYIRGAGDSVPAYASGGNSSISASLPNGVGASISSSSGGLTSNPAALDALAAFAAQLTFSYGYYDWPGARIAFGTQNNVRQVSLGSFLVGPAAVLAGVTDFALAGIQRACR